MSMRKLVSLSIVIVFLTSNLNLLGAQELSFKLAARPQTVELAGLPHLDDLGRLLKGNTVLTELGITDLPSLLKNMDTLKDKGVIAFPLPDKGDKSKSIKYIFIGNGLFIRVTAKGVDINDDLKGLLKLHREAEYVGNESIEIYELTASGEDAVNAILKGINSEWHVTVLVEPAKPIEVPAEVRNAVQGGPNRSHLFPKYIHDALKAELQEKLGTPGRDEARINNILTMGVTFYITDPATVPATYRKDENVAVDDDGVDIVVRVLNNVFEKKQPKKVTIKKDDVEKVLLNHERLYKLIQERDINVGSILGKLRDYYAEVLKKQKDDPDVDSSIDRLLCAFARNYNYLPGRGIENHDIILTEQERTVLTEELLVHEYIERHHFKQPVCIMPLGFLPEKGKELDSGIEKIFFLEIDPKIIVGLYSVLYGINDKLMENYFLMLFKLYSKNLKSGQVQLRIGYNFFPSALLGIRKILEKHPELRDVLTAVEYGELISTPENENRYKEAAREATLILNPMDGGVGSSVDDKAFLKERNIDGANGSKGGNMPVNPGDGQEVSIMEFKLLRALVQAVALRDYRSLQYQILGSKEAADSFKKILGKPCRMPDANGRTYEKYITDNALRFGKEDVQIGMKIPVIDKKLGWLFSESEKVFGHGNHGLRGVYFFQEALRHKRAEGENVVRAIYNGDGINNGVDPLMVGYMVEERIPVVMVTTTKTPIDRKGGMIGVSISKDGRKPGVKIEVKIMELTQAQTVGQSRQFEDTGLTGEQKGKQYFNTNTVLMNVSILQPILQALFEFLGNDEDKFLKIMSPDLLENDKGNHIQIEGALGSVVLNLSNYIDSLNEESPVKEKMRALGIKGKFLRIVNIEEKYRNRFFTPFKESTDYWFLSASGRFEIDRETGELRDTHPEKAMPRFQMANEFFKPGTDPELGAWYKSVRHCFEAFGCISKDDTNKDGKCTANPDAIRDRRTDMLDLNSLEVSMFPVKFGNAKLEGRVVVYNMHKGVCDLASEEIKDELARLAGSERINMSDNIYRDKNGRLVLKDVCVVIGEDDEAPFISKITEEDGELDMEYFARQIAEIKNRHPKAIPPFLLMEMCKAMYTKRETEPLSRKMDSLKYDMDARAYATPAGDKYSSDGKPEPLDGVSVSCNFDEKSIITERLKVIKAKIMAWQDGRIRSEKRQSPLLAMLPDDVIQLTVFNAVNMHDWKRKYEEEMNEESRREVEQMKDKLIAEGRGEEEATKLAVYAVVTAKIAEVFKDFSARNTPVFKPHRIALFPSDEDETKRSKLVLSMIADTPEDMAAVVMLRDRIRAKIGIKDAIAFKRHVTLGYFIDTFKDLEEYNDFAKSVGIDINRQMSRNFRGVRVRLPQAGLTFFTDMAHRRELTSIDWVGGRSNKVAVFESGLVVTQASPARALEMIQKCLAQPAAGPLGKKPTGEYAELVSINVKDGKLGENRDMSDAAKNHAKYSKINREILDRVIKKLMDDKDYGPGILSVIDEIQIVDNIGLGKGLDLLPYAEIGRKGDKTILYLDVDAFDNENVLYVEVEHEISESIMKIVPYVSENIRELTTNYLSLKFVLEKIEKGEIKLDELLASLPELGVDMQFFYALKALVESNVTSSDDEKIIAAAIEHMRTVPYYRELFSGFPFADEWQNQMAGIQDAVERYKKAISIFNDIREAKAMVGEVTETGKLVISVRKTLTGLRVDGLSEVSKRLAEMIGALAKQVGNTDKFAGMLAYSSDKKYLLVSEDRLKQLEEVMGAKDFALLKANLERNNFEFCTEIPQGVSPENIGRLVDPSDLETMTDADKISGMFYLPMPYTRSAVYMTALIVQAKGELSQIPLVRESIGELYKGLDSDDLIKLITAPWLILPKIQPVISEMNNLRRAAALIEKAA